MQDALADNPAPSGETELEATRQKLRTLYEMRRFRYRRLRARRRMKTAALLLAGMLLLVLVVVLAIGIDDAVDGDPSLVLLTGAAGALGGTLANLFRLRDALSRGTELRAFKPSLLAQPAVGAASGLVVVLAVEGGFLGIADQDDEVRWATTTMLAFAAGYSEAMFVGIVRKAADAFSDDARSRPNASLSPTPTGSARARSYESPGAAPVSMRSAVVLAGDGSRLPMSSRNGG